MKRGWVITFFIALVLLGGYNAFSVSSIGNDVDSLKGEMKSSFDSLDNKISSLMDNTKFAEVNSKVKESVVVILTMTDKLVTSGLGAIYVDDKGNLWNKGTGFSIGNGRIMTAAHVTEGATAIVILKDGKNTNAQIKRFSSISQLDLAIIETNLDIPPLEIDDRAFVPVGSKVAFIGFPLNGLSQTQAITNDGIISSVQEVGFVNSKEKPIYKYTINAFVNFGNSGGPVFLADSGKVVGIINARQAIESQPIRKVIGGIDKERFSYESRALLDIQLLMYEELSKNSQMGIGHSTGINKNIIEIQ